MASDDGEASKEEAHVVKFPASRISPPHTPDGFTNIGIGKMALYLNMRESQMTGHWCSRCRGIWFGYAFEVECPACGNRHG